MTRRLFCYQGSDKVEGWRAGKACLMASRGAMNEIEKFIEKIEESKIPVKDEWSEGLNMGLDWAIRILRKDKSAS